MKGISEGDKEIIMHVLKNLRKIYTKCMQVRRIKKKITSKGVQLDREQTFH